MAPGGAQASSKDPLCPKTRPSHFPLLVPRLAVRGGPRARGSLSFRARAARGRARLPAAAGGAGPGPGCSRGRRRGLGSSRTRSGAPERGEGQGRHSRGGASRGAQPIPCKGLAWRAGPSLEAESSQVVSGAGLKDPDVWLGGQLSQQGRGRGGDGPWQLHLSRRVLQSGRVPLTAERTPWRSHRAQCSNLPRSISETLGGVPGG